MGDFYDPKFRLRMLHFAVLWWLGLLINPFGTVFGSPVTPAQYLQEDWQYFQKHNHNLSLAYANDYIAFYIDEDVSSTETQWIYSPLSEAWKLVRTLHDPSIFGNDSLLYVVHHEQKYNGRHSAIFTEDTHGFRNIIDCGHNEPVEENKPLVDTCKLGAIIQLVTGIVKEVIWTSKNVTATNLISDWSFLQIYIYDLYIQKGTNGNGTAADFIEEIINQASAYPREGSYLLRDWYLPIYRDHGGSATVQRFLNLQNGYANNKSISEPILPGEFVYLWSEASGSDLRELAYDTFGWTSDYRSQFEKAAKGSSSRNYSAQITRRLRPRWTEHWEDHNDELNLFYSDDHLAVYFDNDVNASRPWSFQQLSNAWNYAKETFGPLSSDPILYFVLHEKVDYCRASKETSYYDQSYEHKNVIDCGSLTSSGWDADLASNFDVLLENIGHLILRNYNETGNWPGVRSSGWSMSSILVYDIFKGLNRSEDAARWMELQIMSPQDVPKENTYWFRDWYLPIYNEYGGAEALGRFLSILNQNWPQKKNDYRFKLSIGTLVHFWSGAAGENLWPLAAETFSLNTWEHKQFLRAVKDYPNVLYKSTYRNSTVFIPPAKLKETWGRPDIHEEELTLIFVDYNVAVYFDDAMDITVTWPFKLLSDSWGYATRTYGPFSPDPILYVALHDNKYGKCETSREITYFDKDYANRSVIDCGSLNSGWQTTRLMNLLMEQIVFLVMRSAKERGNWPGYQVSEFSMTEILAFDTYMGIGRTEEAVKWHKDQLESGYESPRENTLWYLNWYYPIYAKFGYGKVINTLFSVLDQHWPKAENGFDYAVDLNVGEFLHFWSGAAGVNLKSVANETFGWSELSEKRFRQAREKYPAIQYKDLAEPITVKTQPLYFTEYTFEHKEYVFQNYVDSQLLGYIDADVPRSVQWPFELLSACWTMGQKIYKTMETVDAAKSSKTVIQLILHSGRHFGCRKSLFDKQFAIDCGTEATTTATGWDSQLSKNTDAIVYLFVNMVQMTANLLLDEEALSLQEFSQFLTFDTYLNLQRFEDAHRILTREINKFERTAGAGGFGIRDWYLPIYVNYGGTSVFSAFLKLLSSNWALKDRKKEAAVEKLNTGQTVHFWSEASDQNLYAVSEAIFSFSANQRKEFEEARKEFNEFNYTCYNCHLTNSGAEAQNNLLVIAVAISLACMVLFAIIIPMLVYRRKLNSLKAQIRELTSDEIKEFFEGNGNVTAEDGYSSIESKPFNKDYEIPKERLEVSLDSVLGSGEFGLVVRGILKGDAASATIDTPVAIKTVKPNVDVTCFKALLTELKVIGYLGPHDHIASLLGALTVNIRNREVYVALEFCAKGDLLGYVKKNRPHFKDLFKEETITETSKVQGSRSTLLTDILNNMENHIENPTIVQEEAPSMEQKEKEADPTVAFSTSDLLEWSSQVASGMAFIASKKVIHGDLAARNILLTANNVAKISDFGLSRQLANYSNYMKTSKTPVPWRWMAIESLRDMNFSVQSDAWAYGVTLYEIFSLGTTPYAGWTWDYEFIDKLAAGHRLSSPEFGDDNIYALMMDCMKKEPDERLTFQEMICKLNEIKCKLFPQLAGDVNPNYIQI